ncbi:MAG: hypothetical protein CSA60_01760 [Neptuniibacter caesariensis]|uniref:Uncharacterized protein n=1 Tax=Neptuniibacter caesariensis TaxID=207954 RepID=A0A2G6JNR0_NEPCE|nr:MAG: hypothetical protein CSA60_01760 [Neptuniibacter caesariensis]
MGLKLNCDLGESFGSWELGVDEAVMPHIDQANIACGFHAGEPLVLQKTLQLAKENRVTVGAHPGYPDLVGFGRRSMKVSSAELKAMLQYQIAAIDGMAATQGLTLTYVKPHGAMYNDMMADSTIRKTIMQAIAEYHRPLILMLQSTPQAQQHQQEAAEADISLWFEVFADRCYADDGKLLARSAPGAIHSKEKMLAQVQQLKADGAVTTIGGQTLELRSDTLCVHGDNMEAVQAIQQIRNIIN